MDHPFDQALHLEAGPNIDTLVAYTHPAYANMVGPYGGITAATIMQALMTHPAVQGEPAALTLNYLGPIADGAWTIELDCARTNNSNQHWTFRATQKEAVVVTGSAVFAQARETWDYSEVMMPPVPEVAEVSPYQAAGHPAWVSAYQLRFISGQLDDPRTFVTGDSETSLWLAQNPQRSWDFPALAAAADVFFPRIFTHARTMVPTGTISLTTYFHASGAELAAQGDYLFARASGQRFHAGLYDQSGQVFAASGELLASTHQLVYYKYQ